MAGSNRPSAARTFGVPTPAQYSKGIGLRVLDYAIKEYPGTADAAGVATMQSDYLQQDQLLRVERIVVYGNSENLCNLLVYEGDTALPQRARDGTPFPSGVLAVSEYPSFLTIGPGTCLLVEVTGANADDQFNTTIQYQLVQKVIGQAAWPSA